MKIWVIKISLVIIFLFPLFASAQNGIETFSDVAADSGFFIPIQYLKDRNFIAGYPDGSFHPEELITRAEALAMIFKVSGINPDSRADENNVQTDVGTATATVRFRRQRIRRPFNDVSPRDWFFEIVKTAKDRGIAVGLEEGRYFKPNENISLAEALRMIFQSNSINTSDEERILPAEIPADAWYSNDIAYATSRSLIAQRSDGQVFPPERNLKRGELALVLYRFIMTGNGAVFGYASWYGDGLARTTLTRGNEFVDRNLTAAHKTLPLGTIIRATNMNNGRYVDVVINDRGPYITGRIIDLSRTAFNELASPGTGVIPVRMQQMNY